MGRDIPYLRADVVQALVKETPPRCYHCGIDYEKDTMNCTASTNTWKPVCSCLSTSTIRIVTGGEVIFGGE